MMMNHHNIKLPLAKGGSNIKTSNIKVIYNFIMHQIKQKLIFYDFKVSISFREDSVL